MLGQILELVIFSVIAIILCNRLISLVGKTSDNDKKHKSFFGERDIIKDVTYVDVNKQKETENSLTRKHNNKDLILDSKRDSIERNYRKLKDMMAEFEIGSFVENAKKAFATILDNPTREILLLILIRKRYLEEFKSLASSYGKLEKENLKNMSAQISEIYIFGNNIFIKVIFAGKNIVSSREILKDEWTFYKDIRIKNKRWHLNNVEDLTQETEEPE